MCKQRRIFDINPYSVSSVVFNLSKGVVESFGGCGQSLSLDLEGDQVKWQLDPRVQVNRRTATFHCDLRDTRNHNFSTLAFVGEFPAAKKGQGRDADSINTAKGERRLNLEQR